MTHTVNADRGEVGITLEGSVYPMLPTLAAVNAIESQIGSVYWLSERLMGRNYFPTFREIAVIVAECIRAAGKDRNDPMLVRTSTERVADLLYAEGLKEQTVLEPLMALLANMCTGGAKKKDQPAGS